MPREQKRTPSPAPRGKNEVMSDGLRCIHIYLHTPTELAQGSRPEVWNGSQAFLIVSSVALLVLVSITPTWHIAFALVLL